jgi:hypothetical protein
LLSPSDLEPHKKGSTKLPEAPQVPYGADYGAPPRPGESLEEYRAEGTVAEKRHDVEQARARVTQLEGDNNATADQVQKARNDLIKAQREQITAEGALAHTQLEATQKMLRGLRENLSAFDEIGPKIDADFGVSKGLAGIADNLTKFVASLAAAPAMGQLMATSAGAGGVPKGAGGLIGSMALGGAFGPQYTPEGLAMAGRNPYYAGMMGLDSMSGAQGMTLPGGPLAALAAGGPLAAASQGGFGASLGGIPGLSALGSSGLGALYGMGGTGAGTGTLGMPGAGLSAFLPPGANVFTGPHTDDTGGALVPRAAALKNMLAKMGITDVGGYRPPDQFHEHSSGEALDIMLPGGDSPQGLAAGDQINSYLQAHAAELGLQYTLFKQQEWDPGRGPSPMGDRGSRNDNHFTHIHARMMPGAIPSGSPAGDLGFGGLGGPLQGPDATPGPDMTTDPSGAVIGSPSSHRANWDATHAREAGAWNTNTGNGYYGGLQFSQSSWELAGGTRYAQRADLATPDQQKEIADRLYDIQGPHAWPNTFVPNAPSAPGAGPAAPPHFDKGGEVSIVAHEGEHVFTGPDVDAMGGHGAVYDFRQSLHYDDGGDVSPTGPSTVGGRDPNAGIGSGMPGGGGGSGMLGTAIGGASPSAGIGGGMAAVGGGAAAGAAAGAASMGIGMAAQIAMQEAQRAIQYGGQVAGIATQGLLETFLPTGGSELAQNNWLTRIGGALAGARPALPNLAGKAPTPVPKGAPPPTAESMFGPLTPAAGPGGSPAQAPSAEAVSPVHIEHYHANNGEHAAGADIARHTIAANQPPGQR